jgi:hypothetical protein
MLEGAFRFSGDSHYVEVYPSGNENIGTFRTPACEYYRWSTADYPRPVLVVLGPDVFDGKCCTLDMI